MNNKEERPIKTNGLNQPKIVHELTNVIKEWGDIWKQLYVSHNSNFNSLGSQIDSLILFRKKLSNKKLLVDQLKEKQKLASLAIDAGNKLLGLDIVIRDDEGNKLNPLYTPTIQLYEKHLAIQNKNDTENYKMPINRYIGHVPIKNTCKNSTIHNIDIIRVMGCWEVISPSDVKNDLKRWFSIRRGSMPLDNIHELLDCLTREICPEKLLRSPEVLMNLNEEELLMFLRDILDALFNIYKLNPSIINFDFMIFQCLLYIIKLVSDENYPKFKPVFDLYIKNHVNAELAYMKLMASLKNHLKYWDVKKNDDYLNLFKSFNYTMKFIVRSKLLSSKSMKDNDDTIFDKSMNELLGFVLILTSNLITSIDDENLVSACFKYVTQSITDIMTVFSRTQLSSFLVELIDNLPTNKLGKLILNTMSDIVHSQLFLNADCRAILLSRISAKIKKLIELPDLRYWSNGAVAKLVGDMMDLLYVTDAELTFNDITEILINGLRIVTHVVIVIDREYPRVGYIVSLMIATLRQMTDKHFDAYVKHFTSTADLLDFLKEILLAFTDLMSRPIFPSNWCDLIMVQNNVILKSLKHFARTIREYFFVHFDHEVWKSFFRCVFIFMLQPSLQLERFSSIKRSRIVGLFKDMRLDCEILILDMWSYLRYHKMFFMPDMVGFLLEIFLIPENKIRETVTPMFFDMMQCEFYSCARNNDENDRNSNKINSNFNVFQDKMIENIDRLVVSGKGDKQCIEIFKSILIMHCERHPTMRDQGIHFVEKFTELLKNLLEYQIQISDENINNKINCTVFMLNHYIDIQQYELTISYVNKLCALHLECGNYAETAYTLMVHSDLLSWSNDPLPPLLKSPTRYPACETHGQLKEALFKDMIDYFHRGKMWECAVTVCEELAEHYKSQTFEYTKLSTLLQRMSNFYDNVLNKLRTEPKYFRIAYYGRGFPFYLQNKVFIYRGDEFENLNGISKCILTQFPKAVIMQQELSPGSEITESFSQRIHIRLVKPVMDNCFESLLSTPISEKILQHYRVNYINKFYFSKKSKRVNSKLSKIGVNEFSNLWIERTVMKTEYSLPTMVRWSPVTDSHTYEISPLKIAIETMEEKNRSLRALLSDFQNDQKRTPDFLTMNLYGILDASVMGGIPKYEQAFLTPEYLANHKDDEPLVKELKDLIVSQIPLLDTGLKIRGSRVSLSDEMQLHLEKCLEKLKNRIEENYGTNVRVVNKTYDKNRINITFAETRYRNSETVSSKPLLVTSNSMHESMDTIYQNYPGLTLKSNKFNTVGRVSRTKNRETKRLSRIFSSQDRIYR